MRTINIKGKQYVEVNERIKEFRSNEKYAGYRLTTEIVYHSGDEIMFKASVLDTNGNVIATGHAQEVKSDDYKEVNSTSHVENCETSAIGRCLGILGIGIDNSIATADEVADAIVKQEKNGTKNYY